MPIMQNTNANYAKNKLVYPELSFKINGILFKAKKDLGRLKNEKQYCDVIKVNLKKEDIKYEREKFLPASFIGELNNRSRIDFLIDNKIVLEVKCKPFIIKQDYYQVRRYLDCLNKKLGILVNMRNYYIKSKRVLNSKYEGE